MTKRPQAKAIELIDDSRVRVTRFEFEPGAETGWHTHGFDYVITAVTDCDMKLEEPGGGCELFRLNVAKAIGATKASTTML